MTKAKPALFWNMNQGLGQYKIRDAGDGEVIISMKGGTPTFANPEDKESRDIRIKGFSGSGELAGILKEVLKLGYRESKPPRYPVNYFVEDNALTLCTARRDENEEIVKEFNYLVMKVAGGTLDTVDVTVTYAEAERTFTFSQDGEVIIGGRAYPDDQLYACIFEGSLRKVALQELRERGASGQTGFALPAGWNVTKTYVYVFANSANRKLSSPSVRVYPAPTADELLNAKLARLEEEEREMKRVSRLEAIAGRKERMIEAMLSAREAAAKAREDAIAAGTAPALARLEECRVYDDLMDKAREEDKKLDDALIEAEERQAAVRKEREEKAKEKAKERRKAIRARVAAEREKEKEERRKGKVVL